MTHSLPAAIIFDIDDTLVDTTLSYRGAIIATAAHFGLRVTLDDIARIKAAGDANNDWVVTQTFLSRAGIRVSLDDVTARFEEFYQGTPERPGLRMQEALLIDPDDLSWFAQRYRLGIVTGRPRKDALVFLERFRIAHLFGAVVTMDDGPLKPSPFPVQSAMAQLGAASAWMVGDTPDDIRSAVAAGASGVGVIAPSDDPSTARRALQEAGAGLVLATVRELRGVLE